MFEITGAELPILAALLTKYQRAYSSTDTAGKAHIMVTPGAEPSIVLRAALAPRHPGDVLIALLDVFMLAGREPNTARDYEFLHLVTEAKDPAAFRSWVEAQQDAYGHVRPGARFATGSLVGGGGGWRTGAHLQSSRSAHPLSAPSL